MNARHLKLRSRGEAHCYVAVTKADNKVSAQERARAPFHARHSQGAYDLLGANARIAETIGNDVCAIFDDSAYEHWSAGQHLEEGLRLLREAFSTGSANAHLTAAKLERDLFALAYLDGYDLQESRFVKMLLRRLGELQ